MRKNQIRRQIRRQAVLTLPARRLRSLLMNPWRIFLLAAVVCLFVGYGTALVVERRAIREVDRKFLDNIVQQRSQDADTLSVPGRNTGPASTTDLSHPAVLRAELVVNSAIVRRGELVTHGIVKRKRQSITTSPQHSQNAAEFAGR